STFRVGYEDREPRDSDRTPYRGLVASGDWGWTPTNRTRISLVTERLVAASLLATNCSYLAHMVTVSAEGRCEPEHHATAAHARVRAGEGVSVRPAGAQKPTIGPGDVLKITVWGHDDLSKEYPVTLDGRVPFPLIGSVSAVGLTTTQFANRLRDLLEKDYLVNPQVIVAVREYLSRQLHALGDAEQPGLVHLTGAASRPA